MLAGLQYEEPWQKGQPWPLKLNYSHCPIRLNISSEKMTLALTVFKKSTFQKKSFKCIRKQI